MPNAPSVGPELARQQGYFRSVCLRHTLNNTNNGLDMNVGQ